MQDPPGPDVVVPALDALLQVRRHVVGLHVGLSAVLGHRKHIMCILYLACSVVKGLSFCKPEGTLWVCMQALAPSWNRTKLYIHLFLYREDYAYRRGRHQRSLKRVTRFLVASYRYCGELTITSSIDCPQEVSVNSQIFLPSSTGEHRQLQYRFDNRSRVFFWALIHRRRQG